MTKTTTLSGEVVEEQKLKDKVVLKLKNVLVTFNEDGKREHKQVREVVVHLPSGKADTGSS